MANAAFIAKVALAGVWGERLTVVDGPEWVLIEVFIKASNYSHLNRESEPVLTIAPLISFFVSAFKIIA